MVSSTNIVHRLRLFRKYLSRWRRTSNSNNYDSGIIINSDILLPVSTNETRERGKKRMKVFKLREHWFTEDEWGRRKKFKTEAEANEYAGIVPIVEEEELYEPTEADEWRDYDPDC